MKDRRVLLVALAMITSTVSWRGGTYYTGGLDPVVVVKGLLSVFALALAYQAAQRAPSRFELGTRSFWLLGVYLGCSVFGAWYYGNLLASSVLAVRVAILAATVFFLLRAWSGRVVITAITTAMAAIALIGAATFLIEQAAPAGPLGFLPTAARVLLGTRLRGGLPPLTPNELAFLAAASFLLLLWRWMNGVVMRGQPWLIAAFLLIVWFTGSRTGLVALLVGVAVLLVHVRRWPLPAFLAAAAAVPVMVYLVVGLDLLGKFLDRGGSANVGNLSNRTVAWSAAIDLYHDRWGVIFGSGLSVKQIPVAGQWWNIQILDSSWVSALVQAGVAGVAILATWSLWNLACAALVDKRQRGLFLALVVFMVLRSVLESGLLDATPAFCLFFAISVLGEQRTRRSSPIDDTEDTDDTDVTEGGVATAAEADDALAATSPHRADA